MFGCGELKDEPSLAEFKFLPFNPETDDQEQRPPSSKLLPSTYGWEEEISRAFPDPVIAMLYTATLRFHCMTLRDVLQCTADDLRELGIRMAHRDQLMALAEGFNARMSDVDAAKMRTRRRTTYAALGSRMEDDPVDHMNLSRAFKGSQRNKSTINLAQRRSSGMYEDVDGAADSCRLCTAVTRGFTAKWVDCFGGSPTLEIFLDEIREKLRHFGFPKNFFRLFLDNTPMPLAVSDDFVALGLLFRLPDLDAPSSTSRLVILIVLDEGLIFTYHREDVKFVTLFRDSWESSDFRFANLGTLLEEILRRALRTYEIAVNQLREEMDLASAESDEVKAVQSFAMIQKKTDALEQCRAGSMNALLEASELPHCEALRPHLKALCDRLRTVHSQSDEIHSSAGSSMRLTIAVADFRSNTIFKIFTHIKVLSLPISVATSWYGMNWESMTELQDPEGYRIFAVVVLLSASVLWLVMLIRERLLAKLIDGLKGFIWKGPSEKEPLVAGPTIGGVENALEPSS
jgi:Mg2+ and Co2+ transporter CorA